MWKHEDAADSTGEVINNRCQTAPKTEKPSRAFHMQAKQLVKYADAHQTAELYLPHLHFYLEGT